MMMCSKSHIACDYHFAAFFACTFDNNRNDFASDLSAKKERRRREARKRLCRSDSSGEFLIKAERRKPSHFDDKRWKALKKYVAISNNIVGSPNMCLGHAHII